LDNLDLPRERLTATFAIQSFAASERIKTRVTLSATNEKGANRVIAYRHYGGRFTASFELREIKLLFKQLRGGHIPFVN
jgi:hypothetical protein